MDNRGKFAWQNLVIIGLIVLIIGLAMGWIPDPFEEGNSRIEVYLLDEDLKPFMTVRPNAEYKLPIGPLGVITYNGQEVGGLGFSLVVKPVAKGGSGSGIVTIDWTGYRYVGSIGGSYCSGSKNVDWDKETELIWDKLTDSWIQVTSGTLEIWGLPEGSHTIDVNYNVTATGAVDGSPKQDTKNPSVSCNITWSAGTLSLITSINTTTLQIR